MAATTAQPHFSLDLPGDDTMEISSDTGQLGRDIDIDFDTDFDTTHYEDDDQMLEDARSDRGMTDVVEGYAATPANDDMMDDEVAADNLDAEPHDGMIQDDIPSVTIQDEELLDFTDEEGQGQINYDGDVQGDTQISEAVQDHHLSELQEDAHTEQSTSVQTAQSAVVPEDIGLSFTQFEPEIAHYESTGQFDETAEVLNQEEQLHPAAPVEPTENVDDAAQPPGNDGQMAKNRSDSQSKEVTDDVGAEETQHSAAVEVVQSEADDLTTAAEPWVDKVQLNEQNLIESNVETSALQDQHEQLNATSVSQDEHVGTPTMTGLHPTIVKYQGSEVALFPSSDPTSRDQYFLHDENLVNGSIGDLLQACRLVLGQDITEDEELELRVDDLGLYISEDSTSAFSTSFSELLDLYVQLQTNDGVENVAPLYISFGIKARFTNRMTLLANAASEGKGLSQIPAVQGIMYDDDIAFCEEYENRDEDDAEFNDEESQENVGLDDSSQDEGDVAEYHTGIEGLEEAHVDEDDHGAVEGSTQVTEHILPEPIEPQAKVENDASADPQAKDPLLSTTDLAPDEAAEADVSHDGEEEATVAPFSENNQTVSDTAKDLENTLQQNTTSATGAQEEKGEYLFDDLDVDTGLTDPLDHTHDEVYVSEEPADIEKNDENPLNDATPGAGEDVEESQDTLDGETFHKNESYTQLDNDASQTDGVTLTHQSDEQIVTEHEAQDDQQDTLQASDSSDNNVVTQDETVNPGTHIDELDEINFDDEESLSNISDGAPGLKRSWTERAGNEDETANEQDSKRPRST